MRVAKTFSVDHKDRIRLKLDDFGGRARTPFVRMQIEHLGQMGV